MRLIKKRFLQRKDRKFRLYWFVFFINFLPVRFVIFCCLIIIMHSRNDGVKQFRINNAG